MQDTAGGGGAPRPQVAFQQVDAPDLGTCDGEEQTAARTASKDKVLPGVLRNHGEELRRRSGEDGKGMLVHRLSGLSVPVPLGGEKGLCGDRLDEMHPCCTSFHGMMGGLLYVSFLFSAVQSGVTPASLTSIEDEWSLTATQFAVAGVMYDISQLLVSIPTGHYGVSHIPVWVGTGLLLSVVASWMCGGANNFWLFLAGQALLGIGAAPLWTLAQVHIDNSIRSDLPLVPKYIGWFMAILPLGVVFGFLLVGMLSLLVCTAGDSEDELFEDCRTIPPSQTISVTLLPPKADDPCDAWRWSFFFTAAPIVPGALWFLVSRRSYPDYLHDDDDRLPMDARATIQAQAASPDRRGTTATTRFDFAKPGAKLVPALLAIAGSSRVIMVYLGGSAASFTINAILIFLPRYLERQLCLSRAVAPLILAVSVPAVAAGTYIGGAIPGRFGWGVGGQLVICFTGLSVASTAGWALLFANSLAALMPFLLFGMVCGFLAAAPHTAVLERMVDEDHRGVVMAVWNIVGRVLGSIPGPLVLGALLSTDGISARWAYCSVAVCGFVLSGLFYFLAWVLHRRHGGAMVHGGPAAPDFARGFSFSTGSVHTAEPSVADESPGNTMGCADTGAGCEVVGPVSVSESDAAQVMQAPPPTFSPSSGALLAVVPEAPDATTADHSS